MLKNFFGGAGKKFPSRTERRRRISMAGGNGFAEQVSAPLKKL
jgi:hypothetical protein